jgi:hypothetical protein
MLTNISEGQTLSISTNNYSNYIDMIILERKSSSIDRAASYVLIKLDFIVRVTSGEKYMFLKTSSRF